MPGTFFCESQTFVAAPLVAVLRQLADLLEQLTDDQYPQKPIGVVESSIGGHVRHCLDHVEALLNAADTGAIDYDHRQRGTLIESSRTAAIELLRDQERRLLELSDDLLDQPLSLSTLLAADAPPIGVETSFGRELSYVLSHTIHHNALIGVMAKLLGHTLPPKFGYAPSTIAFKNATRASACAR